MSAPDAGNLNEVLAVCLPTISPALIEPARLSELSAACARLPKAFSAFWGLEGALGHDRGEVDLLIEIRRGSVRHAMLDGSVPSELDGLCEQATAWQELRRFARAWEAAEGASDLVRNVWLEFDLVAARQAVPSIDALLQPSIFWGPDTAQPQDWDTVRTVVEFVRTHFAPFPRTLPTTVLEHAVRALPAEAKVFQLGAMQLRGDVALRVCVHKMPLAAVPDWLELQAWSGDPASLRAAIAELEPMVDQVAIDLDYTATGLGPKIGIECYRSWKDLDTGQWQPLLDYAARLGLCTNGKRVAITMFPAKTEYTIKQQLDHQDNDYLFPVVYRNIHHVKLAFAHGALREAKAYLGVTRPGIRFGFPLRQASAGEPDEWLAP